MAKPEYFSFPFGRVRHILSDDGRFTVCGRDTHNAAAPFWHQNVSTRQALLRLCSRCEAIRDGRFPIRRAYSLAEPPKHNEVLQYVATLLKARGERIYHETELATGMPDIVSDSYICEIKPYLTLSEVQKGVGQLLLYDTALPGKALMLIGYSHTGVRVKALVEKLGIKMSILPANPFPA